ncbi:alpha/beta fold hydrolase [Mycolicibacterium sp. BiH015]|uniref:alpha/beta fold hydrolase n=1 Tax=Mycolicibacterium sp. BiH015 TaxID=3018808 RepID=UPI0022E46930|nr:alpha/beta fold hydrolase [Mycolicibacterium sp. BiH015]MDA2890928.1 alpha/beta fold hydrolase [Mycolicibacterium sp. BiH015]
MSRIKFAGCLVAAGILVVLPLARHRAARTRPAAAEPHAFPTSPGSVPSDVPPERPLAHPTVAAHFEATARSRPGRVALHAAARSVTYGELLAAAHGTEAPHDGARQAALVAGSLTPATVSVILGLFARGTTLVALDAEMPANRVEKIAETLTQHGYRPTPIDVPTDIPRIAPDHIAGLPPLCQGFTPETVTSIQFTSGSTGTPKAVLHTNGLWLADAQLLNDRFGLADGRRVALCMPISFAGGLNVLLGSLMGGAEIIAVDPRQYSAREAFDRIRTTRAQVITCTPSFVDSLHRAARGATAPTVERIVTTGEPIHARHVKLARDLAPNAIITNWVGSTETLAIASHDIAPTAPLPRGVVPVGIPAPHKRIGIADNGAVSITSPYLGRGYLDSSTSTATFVDNGDGTTTYSGGDVGRWDDNGHLVFSGRADNTVKIRGYLVEPAEIEATLASYEDVREVAVVAARSADGTPELAAYVAPSATVRTPSVAELRTRLHRDLPPWMVPAHIDILSALPRGDRGKVDRMALPEPHRTPFQYPCGPEESVIAGLWAHVLRVDRVGRADSFYALGGDSLTVAQMLVELRQSHGVALQPSDLAAAPTVAEFAQRLRQGRPAADLATTTVALRPASADTTDTPLFCFTGAGASALCFVPLAQRVGADTAVYAFEPSGLNKGTLPDWSIPRAVQRHLPDLRRIQPRGPYTLIGHSLGAHIALETARQLEAGGETVDLVVMLDPWLSPRVAREVPGATVTLQTDEANGFRTWWERQKTVPLAGLFSGDYDRKTRAVEEVGMIAGYRHRPLPWNGRALLILSHLNSDDPRLWPRIVTGDVQSMVLDCDHHSMVRGPHIDAVVGALMESRACRR